MKVLLIILLFITIMFVCLNIYLIIRINILIDNNIELESKIDDVENNFLKMKNKSVWEKIIID